MPMERVAQRFDPQRTASFAGLRYARLRISLGTECYIARSHLRRFYLPISTKLDS